MGCRCAVLYRLVAACLRCLLVSWISRSKLFLPTHLLEAYRKAGKASHCLTSGQLLSTCFSARCLPAPMVSFSRVISCCCMVLSDGPTPSVRQPASPWIHTCSTSPPATSHRCHYLNHLHGPCSREPYGVGLGSCYRRRPCHGLVIVSFTRCSIVWLLWMQL